MRLQATTMGVGEAFDTHLPNTSVLITGPANLLLDCGISVPPSVWRLAAGPGTIKAIYLSHAQADHYFGMPTLLGRMWEEGRVEPLAIVSQPHVLEQLRQLLELGYKGLAARFKYPVEFIEARPGSGFELLGMRLDFAETVHAIPNLAIRVEHAGQTIGYSGDGMFTDASRALFNGADLVIHEAFSFERSPIHADIPRLIAMAEKENIGRLAMVHVQRDLRRNDSSRITSAFSHAPERFTLPESGETIAYLAKRIH